MIDVVRFLMSGSSQPVKLRGRVLLSSGAVISRTAPTAVSWCCALFY